MIRGTDLRGRGAAACSAAMAGVDGYAICVCALLVFGGIASGAGPTQSATSAPAELVDSGARFTAHAIELEAITHIVATPSRVIRAEHEPGIGGDTNVAAGSGTCGGDVTVAHTDSNFLPGSYLLQAGFAEDEIFAAEYDVDPAAFPIMIREIEFILAHVGGTATTTQYTVFVWDGPPGVIEVARFESLDDPQVFPADIAADAQAVLVKIQIDPGDPLQIVLNNGSSTDTFSVGVRIDQHNNGPANPCDPIDPFTNAFPVADFNVASSSGNWLFALNCPGSPCSAGWSRFSELATLCTPSGDWVLGATYSTPFEFTLGACCDAEGTCQPDFPCNLCETAGWSFFPELVCGEFICPEPTGACCAFGTCLPDQTEPECTGAPAGAYLGDNSLCGGQGACCMPDGSCAVLFEACCVDAGGTYQGNNVPCETVNCPQPAGACCLPSGCFENLPQANCEVSGTWVGPETTCQGGPCLTLQGSSPPDGAIDARQPSETDGSNATGWDSVTLTFDASTTGLVAGDFDISVTGGVAPTVVSAVTNASDVTLLFDTFIPVGEWTTITHTPTGASLCLGYLPGDVGQDGTTAPADILAIIDCLNGVVTPACALYQCDVDRSDECGPPDILRVIDLLNGVALYDSWFNVTLPPSPCGAP